MHVIVWWSVVKCNLVVGGGTNFNAIIRIIILSSYIVQKVAEVCTPPTCVLCLLPFS